MLKNLGLLLKSVVVPLCLMDECGDWVMQQELEAGENSSRRLASTKVYFSPGEDRENS